MIFNEAQYEAINTIEGPVMVLSGPGTGKTRVITERVLKILENDMKPENILCLTYTDAASNEMRKRLIQYIGSLAHRLEISTFHTFCQKVVSEYKNELGVLSLEPVSNLEQILFFNSIFNNLNEKSILYNYKNPYQNRNNVIKLNKLLKQENLDKNYIYSFADKFLEIMRNDELMYYKRNSGENKKGDFNEKKFEKYLKKSNSIKEATNICYEYRKILEEKGRYELDDLIIWIINLFKSNPDILLGYQERYQYIMVDEFQDSNKTQLELTMLLASYWDNPNLMVVGDDDQSIFRFQGADIDNLKRFELQYSNYIKKIILEINYRSSQQILDAASFVIKKNKTRLIDNKNLIAQSKIIKPDAKIEIVECLNKYYEAAFVIKQIEELHNSGVSYSEIAIIYLTNKESEVFQNLMLQKNIPFYIKKKVNIFEVQLIKKIIKIIEYIHIESKNPYLGQYLIFEILHFDFWNLNTHDLAKLAFYINTNNLNWRDCLNKIEENDHLKEILSESTISSVSAVAADFEYLISQALNVPFIQLLEKIVSRGRILSYILKSNTKKFLLEVLNTFFDFLKQEFKNNPQADLNFFTELLKTIYKEDIVIETTEIFEKKEAVNLTTAHSSKGLEFEAVFVVGCNEENWNKGNKNDNYFGLKEILGLGDDDSKNEERRRLFYVACTRAKSYLYISFSNIGIDNSSKNLTESLFVTEITESGLIQRKKFDDTNDLAIDAVISGIEQSDALNGFKTIEAEFLNEFTENYVLSATHLDDYLDCPVKFYYKYVLHIPTAPSIHLIYGNTVHKVLELFFGNMLKNPQKQYPSLNQLKNWFVAEMEKNRQFISQMEFENYKNLGINEVFPRLYTNFIDEWQLNKNIISENYIKNVVVNNVPIKGKIDFMQIWDSNSVKVADFKTGKYNQSKSKYLNPPTDKTLNENEKNGGKYWRQIAFYNLLINYNKVSNYKVVEGEVIFVEPDDHNKFKREKIFINSDEIIFMEKLINEVYSKIMNHEFNNGCNDKDCEWCNFNKYYINNNTYSNNELIKDETD